MRPSRGMGDMNPAKLPRVIKKRDGNLPVSVYAKGGSVKKCAKGGGIELRGKTRGKIV